jgi:rRNA-processing protein FCF1
MNIESLVIVAVLLVLVAEVTYLVVKLPRQINSKKRMVFVDTSVLIDGRIIAVAKSGFMNDTLVVPRSVIGELQFLADNADHDKRARARYGLDVIKELQEMSEVEITILQDGSKAKEGVDERLMVLAKKYNGAVCTIDYNLNKVATVEGIVVLNVNELAQSLRMAYLPGEKMLLELVQKGQDSHQAVGYLTDGTMVVVEHAGQQVGQTVEIEFIRSLQTAAGKMMFAKRIDHKTPAVKPEKVIGRSPRPQKKPAPKKTDDKVVAAPAEKPTVFHSDSRDQKTAGHQKGRGVNRRSQPKPTNKPATNDAPRAARPANRTSAQREAALLDLVDKQ